MLVPGKLTKKTLFFSKCCGLTGPKSGSAGQLRKILRPESDSGTHQLLPLKTSSRMEFCCVGWFTMGVPPKLSWGVVGTGVLNMPGVPGVPNWVVGVWGPPAP